MVIAGKENGEKKQLRQKERNNIIKKVCRSLIVQTLALEYICC